MTPMPDIELTSAELEEALTELETHQTQLDMDGVMVGVSRQALDILITAARAGLAGAGDMREPYLVWSNEHRSWWRANSQGYAKSIEEAGVYTREEAVNIARTSRDGWFVDRTPDEIPVAVADIPERMRTAIRALPLTGG